MHQTHHIRHTQANKQTEGEGAYITPELKSSCPPKVEVLLNLD